jgi:pyrroloquinoline quinone biosynthesis protein B
MRFLLAASLLLAACVHTPAPAPPVSTAPYAIVLGIAQDGAYPQAGCKREDCIDAWRDPAKRRLPASLGIVDPVSGERWLIEATPAFPEQLHRLSGAPPPSAVPLSGILITHAHIGHYLGLAQLGREVLGARAVPVYAMPRMSAFLRENGPWDQLVRLNNIELRPLEDGRETRLNERLSVTPLAVPHRDEYSETVAFIIRGPSRSLLWLPDIDKWEKWPTRIEDAIARVDVAYLDATFFDERELPGRNLSEIPHPTISESMERFAPLPAREKQKIRFIHLNQSNPALRDDARVRERGFAVAAEGQRVGL